MNTFIFNKDFSTKTITVDGRIKAPLNVVWDAFTNVKTMEKWFAPKPYRAITKTADFREGGRWHYYMLSPEGQKTWGITTYKKIETNKSFEASDAFCDENGTINTEFPQLYWIHRFSEENGESHVTVSITLDTEAQMKQILEMGFEEGYRIALNQLQELLA